jgi:hypothetical protein
MTNDLPEIGTPVKLTKDNQYKFKKGERGIVKSHIFSHLIEIEMGYKPEGSLWSTCRLKKEQYEVVARTATTRPALRLANFVPDEED